MRERNVTWIRHDKQWVRDFRKCLESSREHFCKVILDDEGADLICSMAWKSIHGVTNAGKILVENGLEESMAIEGYWNHVIDSPEGHHCPVCMEPPFRCYGVLYTRYMK